MLRDVQDCIPVFRREWVDSRRSPGLSFGRCPVEQPRSHACRHRLIECPREVEPCPTPVSFARHLERQNWEYPIRHIERPRDSSTDRPREERHCERTENRQEFRVDARSESPRIECARLGDLPRIEPTIRERRLRTVYRIELPIRAGRVIDVLA